MKKIKFPAVISTFIVCYAFWILITWSLHYQELLAGAVVSLAVSLFSSRFFIHEKAFYLFNPVKLVVLLFYSLIIFMWELIKANWDVARRALSPSLPINPGIVRVPSELRSEYGQAMLANSITLTPGTITMEVTEKVGQPYYYIHWIDVSTSDPKKAGVAIKGTLEKWIRRIWQ